MTARVDERTGWVLVLCAIDNLIKGAAGQAVQCANLAWDWPRRPGCRSPVCTREGGGAVSVTGPQGFVASSAAAGLKAAGADDVALVATADSRPVPAAAVFTANLAPAASVQVNRRHLADTEGRSAAVLLTAGNANAATGRAGVAAAERLCAVVGRGHRGPARRRAGLPDRPHRDPVPAAGGRGGAAGPRRAPPRRPGGVARRGAARS